MRTWGSDGPKPRIALVVEELRSTGGQERTVLEIARALGRQFDIHIITAELASGPGTGEEPFRVIPVRRRSRPEAVRFRSFVAAAAAAVAGLAPDLVHGIGANCPGADVVHLQTVNREKYQRLPWLAPRGRLRRLAFRWYLKEVLAAEAAALRPAPRRHYIAVSRGVGEEAVRHYGIPRARIRVVPNGVDLGRFRPPSVEERQAARAELGLPPLDPAIAFVGPDHQRKGLGTALHALARPELAGCRLISLGGAPSSIEQHRGLAERLGVGPRVRFVEHGGSVQSVLRAADLFWFPTLYDPFGMAAAEAMATGLPVLLSSHAGLAEWIRPGEAVVLRDPEDVEELAARTVELLRAPEYARSIGRAGLERAAEWSWARVAGSIAAVWLENLAERDQSTSMASP